MRHRSLVAKRPDAQRGQILVLFVLVLVAILWMTRLLIDGASALALRRSMQDSSDAAALAGANALNGGTCSAQIAAVRTAAESSLAANGWGSDRVTAEIACAPGWDDIGVTVSLSAAGSGMFFAPLPLAVDSTAINGERSRGAMSVVILHRDRCNAFYLNGNVSLTFDGGVHVNSNAVPGTAPCNNSEAAAVGKGGASIVKLNNDSRMSVRGGSKNINVQPPPEKGDLLADPFAAIDEPVDRPDLFPLAINPRIQAEKEIQCPLPPCKNYAYIMSPGLYRGGSLPVPSSGNFLVFLPGVYVFDGLTMRNGGGVLCTLPEEDPSNPANGKWSYATVKAGCSAIPAWKAICPSLSDQRDGALRCGALLSFARFSTKQCTGNNPTEIFSAGGTGESLLRQYLSGAAEGEELERYDGFLLWFSRAHAADMGCNATLRGGAGSQFVGVIYGPTTNVSMAGGGTGAAGSLTLQLVVQTMEFKGGSIFDFHYDSAELSRYAVYGLVE